MKVHFIINGVVLRPIGLTDSWIIWQEVVKETVYYDDILYVKGSKEGVDIIIIYFFIDPKAADGFYVRHLDSKDKKDSKAEIKKVNTKKSFWS